MRDVVVARHRRTMAVCLHELIHKNDRPLDLLRTGAGERSVLEETLKLRVFMRACALLVFVVTLAQPLNASADYLVCRSTGTVMRHCCCPPASDSPIAPKTVRSRCCCDTLHVELSSSRPARRASSSSSKSQSPVPHFFEVRPSLHPSAFDDVGLLALAGPDSIGATPPRLGRPAPIYLSLRRLLE